MPPVLRAGDTAEAQAVADNTGESHRPDPTQTAAQRGQSAPEPGNWRRGPEVCTVQHMTVLGSCVTAEAHADKTIQERIRRAWHAWSQVRAQCTNNRISLAARARLLDAVVLPTLLWGLETLSLTRAQRKWLNTLQRAMLQSAMRLPRRPEETEEAYCRRRERITTARIKDSMRSPWGQTQRFRHFMFMGHVARMGASRLAFVVLRWRGLPWWQWYSTLHAGKTDRQSGRRPAGQGPPKHCERALQEAFTAAKQSSIPPLLPEWRPAAQAAPASRGPAKRAADEKYGEAQQTQQKPVALLTSILTASLSAAPKIRQ